jgi:transcriptional regulator with XRE-family HTH domain
VKQERPKRVELAHFLRTRRERVLPGDVGLPKRSRRRTPGLLREEVAQLADVSVTWYTWLEQGRPVRVSETTLSNVAKALQLSIAETTHLFLLAERPVHVKRGEHVAVEVRRLLDGVGPNPAYITNNCWDVIAMNDAATLGLFAFPEDGPPIARNFVYDILTNPQRRLEIVDWETYARRMVVSLRGGHARYGDDERFDEIINRCFEASEAFRGLWNEHAMNELRPGSMEINHPVWGLITYTFASFRATEVSDLRLTIFTPASADLEKRLRAAIEKKNGS